MVGAFVGLYQTFVGFPFWQAAWVKQASLTYHSLIVNGFVRAFGFSVNAIEYTNLLLISSTGILAICFAGRRAYAIFLPLLGTALFLASSRQPIFKLVIAVMLAWLLRRRGGTTVRIALIAGLVVGLVGLSVLRSSGSDSGGASGASAHSNTGSAASAAAQHQVQGLTDPAHSSAQGHVHYFVNGILDGFKYPLGNGLGMIRGGAQNSSGPGGQGEDTSALNTTEYDISDAFITMGFIGGIAYACVVFLVLRRGVQFAQVAPAYIALPLLSVVVSMVGSWDALGQYGMAPCMWFLIGCLSRPIVKPAPDQRRPRELHTRPKLPHLHEVPSIPSEAHI